MNTLKAKLEYNELTVIAKALKEMVKTLKAKLKSVTCNQPVTRNLRPVSPVTECCSFGCFGCVHKNQCLNSTLLSKLYPIELYHECTFGKHPNRTVDEKAIKIKEALLTFTNGASNFLT